MTIQVTVGIVTWNSARDLPACLAGLAAQTLVDFELVVVDNASQDDSVAIVRAVFPQARVISNDGNAGFSHAHNQAIASSFHPFYLALNPDVILECDYLSALTAALVADPAAGMAGGKLVWPSGPDGARQIDTTGLFLDRRRRQYLRGHGQLDDGRF
ncbi:MAG: glycosyltransferase, partial [Vicinamibacteria bacterium]|nr:glycosyltransferase [Vicinamibacteria bacterium]